MRQIVDDLKDLAADVIIVEDPAGFDADGEPTSYGSSQTYKAHFMEGERKVRSEGELKASTLQAIVFGVPTISIQSRCTVPSRFRPNPLRPMSISRANDENGAHHVTVMFA